MWGIPYLTPISPKRNVERNHVFFINLIRASKQAYAVQMADWSMVFMVVCLLFMVATCDLILLNSSAQKQKLYVLLLIRIWEVYASNGPSLVLFNLYMNIQIDGFCYLQFKCICITIPVPVVAVRE